MNLLETEPAAPPPKITADGFQSLFASSPLAMLIEDEGGYVRDANEAALTLFGGDRQDLLGRHAAEVLPPRMKTTASSSEAHEGTLLTAEGEALTVQVLSVPVAMGLQEATLSTIWGDHVDGPATEGILEQAADCRATNGRIQTASRRIARVLNDRLTALQGFSSLANKSASEGAVSLEHLKEISSATGATAAFVRQLLDFATPQIPERSVVGAGSLLDSLQSRLEEAAGGDVQLTISLGEALPSIDIDAEGFSFALEQMVRNAAQAMGGGGCVAVSADYDREASEVRIAVADDGDGMTPELALRVFEPFFSEPESSGRGGLGLSLALARAEAVGGRIELETKPGEGSVFTLVVAAEGDTIVTETGKSMQPVNESLPSLEPMPPANPKEDSREDSEATVEAEGESEVAAVESPSPRHATKGGKGGKETILIVEDEEMVRDLVKRSLGYLGYEVIDAGHGEEGLAVARQHRDEIDMVFTDIVMPRMSGPEMVAKMNEEELNLPVLYTTGFTDNKRLLDNGEIREGVNLLPKPYTTKVLAARIREVLDGVIG